MGSERQNPPEMIELGGDEISEGSNARRHPERVSRLGDCKKRSLQMGRYIQQEARGATPLAGKHLDDTATEVLSCANYLVFNHYYTVDQVRLAKIMTCKKHMLCPVCARIRAAKQVSRYLERLEVIRKERPGIKLALLTMTVKNGDDLEERYNHLRDAWRTYQRRRRQSIKRGTGRNELCKVDGAVFSYELTNNGQGWHPHLHAVVILNDRINQTTLSQEWFEITGDSFICDIRSITGDPAEGFLEVFKYALKFSELSLEDNLHAFLTLRGKRMQGSFGDFHGVQVPEKMTDELLDDLPYLELFYKYQGGRGYNLESAKPVEQSKRSYASEAAETGPPNIRN